MTAKDRLKELEKIAEKLGIGQKREVKCFCCKETIEFKKAITLTNKKKVTYLCKECYKKLKNGDLNKAQINGNDILREIEKHKYDVGVSPTPWIPETDKWNPDYGISDERITFTTGTISTPIKNNYSISSMVINKKRQFLKFENNNDNKANTTSNR